MMMRILLSALITLLCCSAKAQNSDFPRNYVGLFYVSGYYYHYELRNTTLIENGVDYNSVGLTAARRLTQNFYIQTNLFPADRDNFYADLALKANFLVHFQLQPTGSIGLGSKLGFDKASNAYFGFGLDWHLANNIVLNASLNQDFSGYTYGMRFGGSYKF